MKIEIKNPDITAEDNIIVYANILSEPDKI